MTSLPTIHENIYPELPSTSSFSSGQSLFTRTSEAALEEYEFLHNFFSTENTLQVVSAIEAIDSGNIWYEIFITHGQFEWTIHKKLTDILLLDWDLSIYRALGFTGPDTPKEGNALAKSKGLSEISNMAFILKSKEVLMKDHIKSVIADFLNSILAVNAYKRLSIVINFFEISKFSFILALGNKEKEGFLQKRSSCCLVKNASWNKRWFILKKNFLIYLDPSKNNVEGVFLFDTNTTLKQRNDKIAIKNFSHRILLKCPSAYHATVWKSAIEMNVAKILEYDWKNSREGIVCHSPIRNARAHWFVDGSDYFSAVADALLSATEEIFISGWFLAPHIHLKRRPELNNKWMLKSILKEKADEGVKIYILIYDGPDGFIKLADKFVENTLETLNKNNITVLRHRGKELDILWSHHEKLVIIDQRVAFVSGIDLTFGRWDYEGHPLTDLGNTTEHSVSSKTDNETPLKGQLWPGLDYANEYVSAGIDFTKPFKDHIDRQTCPRIPWHDIACVAYDDAAKDVARHFIQTWNFVKATEHRKDDRISFLIPKIVSIPFGDKNLDPNVYASKVQVQVLRSVSKWAAGLKEIESSIEDAYVKTIEESEHYIYIENQFFISYRNQEIVKNGIVSALCRRIERADREKTKFRLYIVLPLIPMFEGDFSKANKSRQIQVFANYQYHSISRGDETSLIGSLRKLLTEDQIDEYVCFSSLRTYAELNNEMISDIVYVHSKLMIADDRVAIIGSANINDRSLLGDRDSEVALWIKDMEMVDSTMNGQPYKVGKFASGLRKKIFVEHLGLSKVDTPVLNDVVSDEFYHDVWEKTADTNTIVYDEVFRSIPSDVVRRFSQVRRYQNESSDERMKSQLLDKVNGYLVNFPKQYLEDEDLSKKQSRLIPVSVFT
ncbi:phospholipase D1-like [Styela clava]